MDDLEALLSGAEISDEDTGEVSKDEKAEVQEEIDEKEEIFEASMDELLESGPRRKNSQTRPIICLITSNLKHVNR